MEKVTIGDVELRLAAPVESSMRWIGQDELLRQLLACWTTVDEDDLPLCPRIVGQPGMGKTTLALAAAAEVESEAYVVQCTMDTRPEDLVITPVLDQGGRISYHASGLVSAMLRGGVVVLDEANRMSEKSWASLAPLLDRRRSIESVVAGCRIDAHEDFRICVTMNEDASTFEVPDYIVSRLQPLIEVSPPGRDEELEILRYNVSFAPEDLLEMTADFLSEAHELRIGYSTRDGVNIMRFALKLEHAGLAEDREGAFRRAAEAVLGEGALDLKARAANRLLGGGLIDQSAFFSQMPDFLDEEPDDDADEDGPVR